MCRGKATVKKCVKCDTLKSINEFYTNKRDNLKYNTCKSCMKKYQRDRREKIKVEGHYLVDKKQCPTCKGIYPISKFYKDKGNLDGHKSQCKMCCYDAEVKSKMKKLNEAVQYG
jgi:hypothetical protein